MNDLSSLDKCHVLIVEDDEQTVGILEEMFHEGSDIFEAELAKRDLSLPSTIHTHTCKNKEQAIAWLSQVGATLSGTAPRNPCPDLILLDLQIPNSSKETVSGDSSKLAGFEVLKYARTNLKDILKYDTPVVVLSHNISAKYKGTGHGFDQFLDILTGRQFSPPDDILEKESSGPGVEPTDNLNGDSLFRNIARYLVGLDERDLELLEREKIYYGPPGSASRRILRQLKWHARSVDVKEPTAGSLPPVLPLPDVLLLGPNGVGKTTLARAYHIFRQEPRQENARGRGRRLGFHHEDLGSLDTAGSAPNLRLFGGTRFSSGTSTADWTLGAFTKTTYYEKPSAADSSPFEGQDLEEWQDGSPKPVPLAGRALKSDHYPGTEHVVNFERSGTLFLDEVVNVSPAIRKMLLQALSYNRQRRFVYTTGSISLRVPVGPTIIMATRKNIDELTEDEDGTGAARDYMFRIDQVRIVLPPLKDRLDEVVPYLEHQMKLRGLDLVIDPSVKALLTNGSLEFDNNFVDLDRILDQVAPEEKTISFRHVKPLYERSNPLIPPQDGSWTLQQCKQLLDEIGKDPSKGRNLTALKHEMGGPSCYRVVLTFLGIHAPEGGWPNENLCSIYFKMEKRSLEKAVQRLHHEVRPNEGLHWTAAIAKDVKSFCNTGTLGPQTL